MKQNPTIIIMAKMPQIGLLKTQLQPLLSKMQCVEIANSLIGLKNWKDELLENVEWSSANAFSDTFKTAQKLFGEEPFQLPKWFDIDTPEDFANSIKDYSEDAKFRNLASNTDSWLDSYL